VRIGFDKLFDFITVRSQADFSHGPSPSGSLSAAAKAAPELLIPFGKF
jgi:hypothetical protein